MERGGKREKRVVVAKDNTDVAAKTVTDNERQLRFQVVQAFINVLLAKSVLQLAQDDLANYSQQLDLNQVRASRQAIWRREITSSCLCRSSNLSRMCRLPS